jgi:hypothetical protein
MADVMDPIMSTTEYVKAKLCDFSTFVAVVPASLLCGIKRRVNKHFVFAA